MEITSIETPALLVEEPVLKKNIDKMQKFANDQGFQLYPHFKTHKSLKIAEMQVFQGAQGFTVSGLSEAELLIEHGYRDIIIAYPVVGDKINKLYQLFIKSDKRISCITDNVDIARNISERFLSENECIGIFIKINVGLNRCGVLPFSKEVKTLAKTILECEGLKLKGLLSHAGHAYKAKNLQQLDGIAEQEIIALTNTAGDLQKITGKLEYLSVGATPTARFYKKTIYPIVFRPGNYVFNDMIQVSLGTASLDECALSILSTVISKPANNRLIIDAGRKTLASDQMPNDTGNKLGHGGILKSIYRKQIDNGLLIDNLSEEHGIVNVKSRTKLQVGDKIRIIPVHACTVTNLHDYFYFVQGETLLSKVNIEGRGLTT